MEMGHYSSFVTVFDGFGIGGILTVFHFERP